MESGICPERQIWQSMVEGNDCRKIKPGHACTPRRLVRKPDAHLSYLHLCFPDYRHVSYTLLMMFTFQLSLGKVFPIYEKDQIRA